MRRPRQASGMSTVRAYHAPWTHSTSAPKWSRPCASQTPQPSFAWRPPDGHLPGTLKKNGRSATPGARPTEAPSLSTPNAQKPLSETFSRVAVDTRGAASQPAFGSAQPSAAGSAAGAAASSRAFRSAAGTPSGKR